MQTIIWAFSESFTIIKRSQIPLTNDEKFDILRELPKRDTKIWSEQMMLEKMAPIDLLKAGLLQIFNL